jgi:hypothetical protein
MDEPKTRRDKKYKDGKEKRKKEQTSFGKKRVNVQPVKK